MDKPIYDYLTTDGFLTISVPVDNPIQENIFNFDSLIPIELNNNDQRFFISDSGKS